MAAGAGKSGGKVVAEVKRLGLLLLSDKQWPSVVSLVSGGPIRGSWWGAPRGGEIYAVSNQLADRPDVLTLKLISGRITYVQRRLWPAVYAIGMARAAWQMEGLSPLARKLLGKLDKEKELETDWLVAVGGYESKALSAASKQLERRLLCFGEQVHTEKGKHATRLKTWPHWAEGSGFALADKNPREAIRELEEIVEQINTAYEAKGKLPWQ
jgi:hypothetical protein